MKNRTIVVDICLGSACYLRGGKEIMQALQSFVAKSGLEDRVALTGRLCEELCSQGPSVTIDGNCHARMSADKVIELIERRLKEGNDEI